MTKKRLSTRSRSKLPNPTTEHRAICERFKQTRKEAGINQTEAAEALGITLSLVKQIETGRVIPNILIIRRWHKYFRRSYGWIIDGE